MELWPALILGFFGSIHCLGMCGPIALALPGGYNSAGKLIFSRLVYNAGRIVTYMFFGALVGAAGQGLALAGLQQAVSLISGSLLLLVIVLPGQLSRKVLPIRFALAIQTRLQTLWASLSKRRGLTGLFAIGLTNGLLPCGFLYLALAGAVSAGSVSKAVLFMGSFGAGTVPALLAVSLSGGIIGASVRNKLTRAFPIAGIALAVLLILRGLALDIPYLSPDLSKPHSHGAHSSHGSTLPHNHSSAPEADSTQQEESGAGHSEH